MKAKSPPRMQVVKREDKQRKLTDFISTQLDRLAHEDLLGEAYELQLVALSATSPVIAAFKTLAAHGSLANAHLRIIFANIEPTDLAQELAGLPPLSISWACNGRLLEAHEQLVISETSCWIGDCMRREPSKRDAFECFADDCRETTAWAKTSFERLWAISVPLVSADRTDDAEADMSAALPLHSFEQKAVTIAGTLH